jgi:uncharacterized lipoprotein YehR (DUF1307 family)
MKHFIFCIVIVISFISCNSSKSDEFAVNAQQTTETKTTKYEWKSEVFKKVRTECRKDKVSSLEDYNKPEEKLLYEMVNAGYPEAVPLEDAVAFYNMYFPCVVNYLDNDEARYVAPLRTAEVLASIRSQDCKKGSAVDKKICNEIWKISETGKMPKGSFIDHNYGEQKLKGFRASTMQIWLSLYMDKNRRDLTTGQWFQHKIRETYLDSEKQ